MAAGAASGSARARGSVRGVPVGCACIARRATVRSRGRPEVHIPSRRPSGSSVKALQASSSGVGDAGRLAPDHLAHGRCAQHEQPPGADITEHVRDRVGRRQPGCIAPPARPEPGVQPLHDRRGERLRGVEGLRPVPPGQVRAPPGRPALRRVADGEHPGDARTPPRVDEHRATLGPRSTPEPATQSVSGLTPRATSTRSAGVPDTARAPPGPARSRAPGSRGAAAPPPPSATARPARTPPGEPDPPAASPRPRTGPPAPRAPPPSPLPRSRSSRHLRPPAGSPGAPRTRTAPPRTACAGRAPLPGPTPSGRTGRAPVATTTARASTRLPSAHSTASRPPEPGWPTSPLGPHAQAHLVGMGPDVHPHRGAQVHLGVRVLGQGRSVVRGFGLRPEQDDPPRHAGRPQQRARARPRQPGPDDHHIRHEPAA